MDKKSWMYLIGAFLGVLVVGCFGLIVLVLAVRGMPTQGVPIPQASNVQTTSEAISTLENSGGGIQTPSMAVITATRPKPSITPSLSLLTNENWGLALSNADDYINVPVSLTGRIFLEPQIGNGAIAFQMYTNRDATDGNTVVIADASVKVKKGDFVRLEGTGLDMYEGTNAFGATLRVPRVRASKIEIVAREDVVAPAIKKINVNQAINQHGLVITLVRVEIAKEETRFYLKAHNQSTEKASIYRFNARMVQGSKQFEPKSLYDSGYPEIPSDMLSGVEGEGVIIFDTVSPSGTLRFVWDGPRLDDYSLKFQPYSWDVQIK